MDLTPKKNQYLDVYSAQMILKLKFRFLLYFQVTNLNESGSV